MISEQDYQALVAQIAAVASDANQLPSQRYGQITNILARSRVGLLTRLSIKDENPAILSGPFEGMRFHSQATEGCYLPKVLGCYEAELHPFLLHLAKEQPYKTIIDVGCAEGYYAVGLARLMPAVQVKAFDIDPRAQEKCRQLAQMNGVAERITVAGELTPQGLADAVTEKTLIFCDCEGFEYELFPKAVPALGGVDMLIELHNLSRRPEQAEALIRCFEGTHEAGLISQGGRNPAQIPLIAKWKHLDQLLAVWEFRSEPTPWLWLKSKGAS